MMYLILPLLFVAAVQASAAEVVVYSPRAESLHVSGAGHTTAFPSAWTGHRSVCAVPGEPDDVFEAWTGGETYSVGNPCGTSAGRIHPAIDLTDFSPIFPRVNVLTGAADRAPTIGEYVEGLYDSVRQMSATLDEMDRLLIGLEWSRTNRYTVATPRLGDRVRVVRWLVDGQPIYRLGVKPDVIIDKTMTSANRAFLTEADVLATGALDLDWEKLQSDVVGNRQVIRYGCAVTNVAYLVVIGDGKVYWESIADTNSAPVVLDRVIERRYSLRRTRPTPVGSSLARGVASFSFRIDDDPAVARYGQSYTACKVRVRRVGASVDVWTSGVLRLPARDPATDVYTLSSADAALTDALASDSCTWSAAIYNSKFANDLLYDTTGCDSIVDMSSEGTNVFSTAVLFTP